MAGELSTFLGGFSGAAVGSAIVRLYLDSSQYAAGLAKSQAQLSQTASSTGQSVSKASQAWSIFGAAAVAAMGTAVVAAVRAAAEFDQAFTRIGALSNASEQDISRWKEEVLSLAQETAVAPQELADALFFLSSAGLDAAEVMPALEAAAKGAASGMGDMTDLVNVTASAMNAYAKDGLKAADVMDILTAAIREGRAEPAEFAEALGRILPIASKAGVSFDEVAGSLATLSNIGLDVNEGVTAMRGLLQALEAPGTQAAEALAGVGISTDELRNAISEGGILEAMRLLEERTGGNIDTLRKIVPNIRALTGQFGITEQEAAKVDAIFARVANSTGSLDRAFQTTREGAMFQFRQAVVTLQAVAIELGATALPAITKALKLIVPVLQQVIPRIDDLVLAFLAFKGVPLLLRAVALGIGAIGTATKSAAIGTFAAQISTFAGKAGILAGAIALVAPAFEKAARSTEELAQGAGVTTEQFEALEAEAKFMAGESIADVFRGWADPLTSATTTAEEAGQAFAELKQQLLASGESAESIDAAFTDNLHLLDRNRISIEGFIRAIRNQVLANRLQETAMKGVTTGLTTVADATDIAARTVSRFGHRGEAAMRRFNGFSEKALNEFRKTTIDTFTTVDDTWATLSEQSRVTAQDVLEAFRKQNRSLKNYSDNVRRVKELGLEDEVIASLSNMGLEGAVILEGLANASKREIGKVNDIFKTNTDRSKEVATSMGAVKDAVKDLDGRKAQATVQLRYEIVGALDPRDLPGLQGK